MNIKINGLQVYTISVLSKRSIIKILICFVLCLFTCDLAAQKKNMTFHYLTTDDGLSDNRVSYIFRDSRDYVWIGTENGLNKYDGHEVVVYRNDSRNPKSICNNRIMCIAEDAENNLWVGTRNGLSLYNANDDSFVSFYHVKDDSTSISSNFINCFYIDKQGGFWIGGSHNEGLNKWNPVSKTFTRYSLTDSTHAGQDNAINDIAEDKAGNLWLASRLHDGLVKFEPGKSKFTVYEPDIEVSDDKKFLFIDNEGIIWISTFGSGLYSFNPVTQKYTSYNYTGNGKGTNSKVICNFIQQDENHLLMGADQGGINRYNKQTGLFEYITYNPEELSGLNNNGIWYLYRDKEDILWIGTAGGGVNIYNPKSKKFRLFRKVPGNPNSLGYNVINSIYEDSKGLIWTSTDGRGVSVYDPQTGNFKNHISDRDIPGSLPGKVIRNVVEDRHQNYWFATWGDGLIKLDHNTGKFTQYLPESDPPYNISGQNVWHHIIDHKGIIWLSIFNVGIDLLDPDKGIVKRIKLNPNVKAYNNDAIIRQIYEDSHKNMWFCTNAGLKKYDSVASSLNIVPVFPEGHGVRSFLEDREECYWAGGNEDGLIRFSADGTILKTYTVNDGLPDNTVNGILEDNSNHIWISTNKGISRINYKTGNIKNYSPSDGLQGNQFLMQSCLKTKSGEMYFGGTKGLNAFFPDSIKNNNYIPRVYINEFRIFNKPVPVGEPGSPLQKAIEQTRQITLSWKQSVFSLGFAAINYTNPKKNLYKYKMEGFDKDWNMTNASRRLATYTNLDPGSYVFHVKAANNDGVWNEQGTSIKVMITPPWWRTWQARIIAVMLLTGGVVLIYRRRVNRVERHNKKLEEEVAERTSSLTKVNEELSQSQHKLKLAYDQVKLTTDALNQIAIIVKGDAKGCVTDVNQAFLEVTGYDKSEIVGMTRKEFSDLFLSTDVHSKELLDEITVTLRQGNAWRGEVCYKTRSGDPLWLLKHIIPLQEQGVYMGFFSFGYDITLKKKQEEELVEAKRIAEDALAAKESFLSVMSHEIRTPLNSVIGLSNLLLKRNPPQDQMEIVMTLKNSGDNLMYLINNILDYNKIRAGKIELENLPFDLKDQLRQLQFSHQPLAVDKGLDLKISISSNTPVNLIGDSLRLNQILNNLLNNAIKFTQEGHVKLSVSLKSSVDKRCELLFIIEDSGIGISKAKLKTIFTPFQQSENYITREFGGSGLGLSIVKDLVDLLHGSIAVESSTNVGTTFRIMLPFKLGTEVLTFSDKQELPNDESGMLVGYRILYVEDVESNQTLVKNLLNDYKIECVTASNGEIALLHTSKKHFDVILMDLQMPAMSGYEIARAIQHQKNGKNHQTPIIAFTAESYSESLRNKILDEGMQGLVTKPFRFEQLIKKIKKVCPQRTTKDEFLSFEFYEQTFNYDKKQLNEFKDMLVRDFKKFETAVHDHQSKKDIAGIRLEIHKMVPIVKNLKCMPLLELFNQYKKYENHNSKIEKLNQRLDEELQNFFSYLDEVHY